MFETITYQTPNGQDVSGYLARAAGNSTKSIVVIQEWWGLNDQIRGVADRFAAAGFNALAPDLYNGRVTENADEEPTCPGHGLGTDRTVDSGPRCEQGPPLTHQARVGQIRASSYIR